MLLKTTNVNLSIELQERKSITGISEYLYGVWLMHNANVVSNKSL